MISKLKDQKIQKRLLIIALVFTTSLAVASVTGLLSDIFTTKITRGSVMKMELIQTDVEGTVVPGQTLDISPVIKNKGSDECLAFVKVTVPTYGSANTPAYTYTIDEDNWIKVGGTGGEAVYGYNGTLDYNDEASAPMDGIMLENMEIPDFLDIPDLNITVTGYLAETAMFGSDPQGAWDIIKNSGS